MIFGVLNPEKIRHQ